MKTTDFRETNLKATNLMIGDWLYAIDDNGETHPCRVNNLEYDYTNKRDEFSLDFYGTGYKPVWPDVAFKVEPIPLTPEILEKNGWEWNGELWVTDDFLIENGYDYHNRFWWSIFNSPLLPINSVHELQHALKLCGIEKEITL